jgi:hypothetical protein
MIPDWPRALPPLALLQALTVAMYVIGHGEDHQDLRVSRPHSDRHLEATTNTLLQAVTSQAAVKSSRTCVRSTPFGPPHWSHDENLAAGGHIAGRGEDQQDLHANRPHSDRHIGPRGIPCCWRSPCRPRCRSAGPACQSTPFGPLHRSNDEYLVVGGHIAGRGEDLQDLHVHRHHLDRHLEAATNTLLQAVTLQAAVKSSRTCMSIDTIRAAISKP